MSKTVLQFPKPVGGDQPLTLSDDARAVAVDRIRNLHLALHALGEALQAGQSPTEAQAIMALRLSEHAVAGLATALGIPSELAEERAQRTLDLRTANLRVRELEAQIGDAQAPEAVQLGLQALDKRLDSWWRHEGLGHITGRAAFGPYGCRVTLCCHLFGARSGMPGGRTQGSEKERKRQWHQSLRERGLVLTEDDGEVAVIDCDASRAALFGFIQSRLPSARIEKTENTAKHRSSECLLREIVVYIHDLGDILTLPVLPDEVA
ncbi:hypothetical protein [Cupriavidus sp. TMH.W2]|uniref:hypothetical protein n=1 Tax=Cupriavidus sp. TMH.W2 TaxID=3434465 RepID=UPI003D788927